VSLASRLLMAAIRGYKRQLSPRKGFACAYRVHLGACSCSTLGLRAISRYGAWRGLGVLQLRLQQCAVVARQRRARPFVAHPRQAGFLDCAVPCDGACVDASACSCDQLFSADGACGVVDSACQIAGCVESIDCGDCGCWPWSRRQEEDDAPVRRPRRRGDPVG
jgi:putative component of membrane protein insertase Oxa1/YidC/SpoIIIJ protein YidD